MYDFFNLLFCVGYSCFLLDFEGNVWSFGNNLQGQLGHGYFNDKFVPTKIECLLDIQQISKGSCGSYFLAKSHNKMFISGSKDLLGTEKTRNSSLFLKKLIQSTSQFGESHIIRAKSARK